MLDTGLQQTLRAAAPVRAFAAGQIIQQRGDRPEGFWLIDSGAVTVGQFLPDGDFRAIALLGPGDSYGELALLSGRTRVVDAVARSAASLRWISGSRFEAAMAADPAAMRVLMGALAEELQEMIELVAGHRGGNGQARVAGLLVNLSSVSPVVEIGQQELGELAGITRATANAALKELEMRGLIKRGYRKLEVLDRQGLRQAAD